MPVAVVRFLLVVACAFGWAGAVTAKGFARSECPTVMPTYPPRVTVDGFSIIPPAGQNWCGMLGLYHSSIDFFRIDDGVVVSATDIWAFARRVVVAPPDQLPQELPQLLDFTLH